MMDKDVRKLEENSEAKKIKKKKNPSTIEWPEAVLLLWIKEMKSSVQKIISNQFKS